VDTDGIVLCPQIQGAQQTATKIQAELANLNTTLKNIEDARPFEQLSVGPVALYLVNWC
jgi:hypothetical protein